MPRNPKKLKMRWIDDKKQRQATFRNRRATLLAKAKELATLCDVPVAVVVYGYGEAVPATWPSEAETKEVLERYAALPDTGRGNGSIESYLQERIEKVTKTLENVKDETRNLNADLILNEIKLQRRHNLDNLTPEVAAAVRSLYVSRMKLIDRCIKFPLSQAMGLEAELEPVLQDPANAAIMSGPQNLVVSEVPAPLPLVELDAEPHHGSFVIDIADAIIEDGSGSSAMPADADVQRILKEYGLHDLFKPE